MEAGDFDERFPGELEITEEYTVSRHTVRRALAQLRDDGVIVAGRGRQSRVAPTAEIRQPMGALYSLFASVEAAGLTQASVVRHLDLRADGVVAEHLGLEASVPLVFLDRLRMAGDEPLALDRVWLDAEYARPVLEADFTHTGLYRELANRAGIRLNQGTEEIRALVPGASEAMQLRCPSGTAAFAINRLGWHRGRRIEWRQTLVRADRFSLTAEFTAKAGYQLVQPAD